jgi:oligopeptide/dipeptide ABC transporter ATP-binding protein
MSSNYTILKIEGLTVQFPVNNISSGKKGVFTALDNMSLYVNKGEALGIAGESGCGKTTLGKTITGLQKYTSGKITFENRVLSELSPDQYRRIRSKIQMVFQNPYTSLNPRMTVFDILTEPLRLQEGYKKDNAEEQVATILEQVGLDNTSMIKYPHEFSGGQRQRIAIARALAINPSLIIADEPVSSLDVSVQAQILNLLRSINEKRQLSMIFISHDLSVVKFIAHRVAIMFKGSIVEFGDVETIFKTPWHPYTETLLKAIPVADPDIKKDPVILKENSSVVSEKACPYYGRCIYGQEQCLEFRFSKPSMDYAEHFSACMRKGELQLDGYRTDI